ncbi:hypothetical protein LIA77_08709 [Sarocladium implicatum]|nr:hypothetical protein LIA77_08709 [Sarocladium implicatum]
MTTNYSSQPSRHSSRARPKEGIRETSRCLVGRLRPLALPSVKIAILTRRPSYRPLLRDTALCRAAAVVAVAVAVADAADVCAGLCLPVYLPNCLPGPLSPLSRVSSRSNAGGGGPCRAMACALDQVSKARTGGNMVEREFVEWGCSGFLMSLPQVGEG